MPDPYRTSDKPPKPHTPKFSPFRPIKQAFWWFIQDHDSDNTALTYALLGVTSVATLGLGGGVMTMPEGNRAAGATLIVIAGLTGAPPLLRLWLRSARHLDNADSKVWWEDKLK